MVPHRWPARTLPVALWIPLLLGGAAAAEPTRPIVAVFEIQNKGTRLGSRALSRLTDYLATRLAASGSFSGLRAGDRLLRFGDEAIATAAQVVRLARAAGPDQSVVLRVLRGANPVRLEARLGAGSEALATASRACAEQDAVGCHFLGTIQRLAGAPDVAAAYRSIEKACSLGNKPACTERGAMMVRGEGTSKDLDGGKRLLRAACDRGDGRGCHQLADVAHKELAAVPPGERLARAREIETLLHRSCGPTFLFGCFALGLWYEKREPARAVSLYQRACQGGEIVGCSNWGWLIYNGRGTAKDLFRGISLLRQGCREAHRFACDMIKAIGVDP